MTLRPQSSNFRLSDALNRWDQSLSNPVLPTLLTLREGVDQINKRWPAHSNLSNQDREQLVQQVNAHLKSANWSGCKLSDVLNAAEALFDGERRDRGDLEQLRNFYFGEILSSENERFLNKMLSVYISSFALGARHTNHLAASLSNRSDQVWTKRSQLIRQIPEILSPGDAPTSIARLMIGTPKPFDALVNAGVREPFSPGLMDFAHSAFLSALAPSMAERESIDKLLAWLHPSDTLTKTGGVAEAITTLLRPWIDASPSEALQSYLTRVMVDLFKDPRRNSGYPWHEVGEQEIEVFLRWLTGENLKLLFDAISDTMTSKSEQRMWRARREFYLGLHDEKRIDAAWVAFSSAGAQQARQILKNSGAGAGMQFGRQTSSGLRANTSILVAQVGRKIIVDGSHNYKVHVFDKDDPKAPALFQDAYSCEAIRLRTPETQKKSHNGRWENWVLLRI